MSGSIDMTGVIVGQLTVLKRDGSIGGKSAWLVRCDCGIEKTVSGDTLRTGKAVSCGCIRASRGNPKHGKSKTTEYVIWCGMIKRCENDKHHAFTRYGGRGIKVCGSWRSSFEVFLSDMGPRPSAAHSIDRIDNDGNYEPGNCRWATAIEQARNSTAYKDGLTHMTKPALIAEVRRLREKPWETLLEMGFQVLMEDETGEDAARAHARLQLLLWRDERDALRAEVERLRQLRCDCDEDAPGGHAPGCIVSAAEERDAAIVEKGTCLPGGPAERDRVTGNIEQGPHITERHAKSGDLAVMRVDQSPVNAKRWALSLSCGHEVWISANKKPARRTSKCPTCARVNLDEYERTQKGG